VEGAGEAETSRDVEFDMAWMYCRVLERSGRDGPAVGKSAASNIRDGNRGTSDEGATFS
jgi:hypothetical protein